MSGRMQTVVLPNGRFLLIFDCMPNVGCKPNVGADYLKDWVVAREELLKTTGAAYVLRFDHRVDVVGEAMP